MGGIRRGVAVLALVVAAALIGALAWNLLDTQADGRRSLRDALDHRAALTGKLIGSAFLASNTPENARAEFGGPLPAARKSFAAHVAAAGDQRLILLDAHGHVLLASPADLKRDDSLLARNAHLRTALAGTPALSDQFRDRRGRPIFGLAIPFSTPSGRRVLAASAPVEVVRNFAEGFFASASAIRGSQGYLLDGSGRTLSASGPLGGQSTPPPARLRAALEHEPSGTAGDRTFVSAPVPSSHWRVVLSVPTARLYAAVDGGPGRAAWQLFAAFAAAICALLALGFLAARGARRLAAATERERSAQVLAHERLHDALTGLPNRTLFADRADQALATARRHTRSLAVLFMDIDHFKRINDSLGHEAGDAVLREVARRLNASVRPSDTVSRFGGDEFVVLCEGVEEHEVLGLVARIQDALSSPLTIGGREMRVTFSTGVGLYGGTDDDCSAADLVRDADAAMYRAKQLGRGRVELFDGELHRQAMNRLDAEVALRRAIDEEQFVVHYQPIVHLSDGAIRGVEALVRWERPGTEGLVAPGDFIPLAEETGMIVELGGWVLRAAVRQVDEWSRDGLIDDDFDLSVNVSARQLSDPRLVETVAAACEGWNRPAHRLCLEITESAVMLDPEVAQRTLHRLHDLGVRLALDDFGVGHSSLGQLARSLPISVLKLDRSFVAGMTGSRDRGILQAAASLARALDLSSVAEGVESPEQARALAAMGFPYAQGFHFGRPVAPAELMRRFGRSPVG